MEATHQQGGLTTIRRNQTQKVEMILLKWVITKG
jgi:hypothetical protein